MIDDSEYIHSILYSNLQLGQRGWGIGWWGWVVLTQFLSGRWGCLLLTHLNIIRNFNWSPLLVCVRVFYR